MPDRRTSYNRRRLLVSAVSASAVGLTGCLGGSEDESEPPDGGSSDANADLDPEQATLVESWLDALSVEREVQGFRVFSDQILPEYTTGGSPDEDIPVLAQTYANAVDEGLNHVTMPMAMEDDRLEFMVYIYPEWATEYTSGEIGDEEYFELIRETIH